MTLPSVSQCASPVLVVAVVLGLPVKRIGELGSQDESPSCLLPFSLCYCGLSSEAFHSLFPPLHNISPLTCFFFRASSDVFWTAFRAAGLYTVFVRPTDVENT